MAGFELLCQKLRDIKDNTLDRYDQRPSATHFIKLVHELIVQLDAKAQFAQHGIRHGNASNKPRLDDLYESAQTFYSITVSFDARSLANRVSVDRATCLDIYFLLGNTTRHVVSLLKTIDALLASDTDSYTKSAVHLCEVADGISCFTLKFQELIKRVEGSPVEKVEASPNEQDETSHDDTTDKLKHLANTNAMLLTRLSKTMSQTQQLRIQAKQADNFASWLCIMASAPFVIVLLICWRSAPALKESKPEDLVIPLMATVALTVTALWSVVRFRRRLQDKE